jgi:diguanylate cyclase (GGDEF)-like protein
MRHQGRAAVAAPEPGADVGPALAGLARSWIRVVARAGFVPGPRARARATLEELLRRLAAAIRAEPFDPTCGYRVGLDLVGARMSSPAVLGESITLLSRGLPAALGRHDDATTQRLAALLGQVATGFTEALRDAAVDAAESINRAERAAWRRKQLTLQRRLQYALLHDPLTQLPNRSKLLDCLSSQITGAGSGSRLGVCLLNLDRFKAVNDNLGHDKGDRLLQAVARQLRRVAAGQGYFLAHLGADEFALVMPDTTGPEEMVKAVDQVLRALPDPFLVDGHRVPVTARAGMVECAGAGADATELLRAAHTALGWAQTDRRGRYAIFDWERSEADIRRHELTAAMPAALENREFVLDYQPLIQLADRRIVGVEALARWHHPTLGVLGPDQFIPLAEQTGLIEPLGLYLLERACRHAAGWSDPSSQPVVSVNLAAAQLSHPGLPAAVASVLDRAGLPPWRLQLEITESSALDAYPGTLRQLADLGVALAIDDFGTGYSSLAYLAELPIVNVKLAARFVHGIGEVDRERSIAKILPNVIDMCHDLDIAVTAEGIETADQVRHLTELGCDTGQGYHLARPTSAENVARMLAG